MEVTMRLKVLVGVLFALLLCSTACAVSPDRDDDFDIVTVAAPVQLADSSGVPNELATPIYVGIAGKNGEQASVDATVSGLIVIDIAHREIHEGNTFNAFLSDLALADDASLTMLFTTSNNSFVSVSGHMVLQYAAGGDAQVFVYEAPTVSTIGTAFTAQRLNREIAATAVTTISTGATFSSYGTTIFDMVIAGGTGGNAGGGAGSHDDEFILTPGTQYLIRLENEAGSTKVAGIHVDWYEE